MCIFCKIAAGEIKSKIVYEDKDLVAFDDVNPQAPVHVILIPRAHIETINDADGKSKELLGGLMCAIPKIAAAKDLAENGYRVVFNCKKDAGQEVMHIHAHILGGRKFRWPPG